ncbi:MAG: ZIP family metal transporter [Firmicutes bacterium]|nr:ZIP family metal transporter [Bacillota bacterium]
MTFLILITLLGSLAGVLGTGLGGLAVALFPRLSQNTLSGFLGFAGGVMLAVVAFDLLPEAFAIAPLGWGLMGLVAGTLLLAVSDLLLPHMHFLSTDEESQRFLRTGLLIGIGVALHNLPEGLAIGAGFGSSRAFGLSMAFLIALQNVPEGMAMACPLCLTKIGKRQIILWTFLAGFPMGLGAFLGGLLGRVSPVLLALALGFAAGSMLFITCDELIPDAHELRYGHSGTFGIVIGVILGVTVSSFFHG